MSHVRRPRHHRASTRRLAGARPDGVHRGWIHPLHDRAVDVFRPLLTPVHWGVFVTAATPWKCARTLRFRPAQSIPRRPSGPGSFWPYTPLHPLKKPGLNGHFSLFAIWPAIRPIQPYFRSCFGPRLCKCTNLGRHSIFALLYVSVLCSVRNSSLVKVCAFAQTLTTPLSPPKSARNIAQREAAQGRRPGAAAGRVPAMSQKCGEVYGC